MVSPDLSNSLAIRLTRFFMRFTGIWMSNSPREKLVMNLTTAYALYTIIFSWHVDVYEIWFCRNDFQKAVYAGCNLLTILLIGIKLGTFAWHREKLVNLIKFCYDNFWTVKYDIEEMKIMKTCDMKSTLFVGLFTFFAWCTVCAYTAYPIVANLGKNDSDRIHAFPMSFPFLPATVTPYYEIIFVIEELALIHSGICYFCFDNILCIMNVHTAGQFRLLQRKLELIPYEVDFGSEVGSLHENPLNDQCEGFPMTLSTGKVDQYSRILKSCIERHKFLIGFAESLEDMYTLVILAQFIIFSLLICLVSYQAVLADGELSRRMIFIVHSAGTFVQLFMFTLTCDDLMRESEAVATAAYCARWYRALSERTHKNLGKDLMFIIMRAQHPCCLTAGGFFPISLETFTTILTTSMSYLTLLRSGQEAN